jgi:hypothetical protein
VSYKALTEDTQNTSKSRRRMFLCYLACNECIQHLGGASPGSHDGADVCLYHSLTISAFLEAEKPFTMWFCGFGTGFADKCLHLHRQPMTTAREKGVCPPHVQSPTLTAHPCFAVPNTRPIFIISGCVGVIACIDEEMDALCGTFSTSRAIDMILHKLALES